MADQPQSLRAFFEDAKATKQALESAAETNTDSYRSEVNAAIAKFEECRQLVSQLSLFSRNESLDDVATGDLQ